MARLVYVENGARREFALEADRTSWSIGRNPVCDLCINSPSMSRRHAEIRLDSATGRFTVYDNKSANGTFVNGQRAEGTPLTDGDEILLAEFKVRFVEPPRKHTDSMAPAGGVPAVPEASGRVEIPPASQTLAGGRVAAVTADPAVATLDEDIDVLEMEDLVEDEPSRPMTASTAGRPSHEGSAPGSARDEHAHTPFAPESATAADSTPSTDARSAESAPAPGSGAALELARRERDRYQDQVRTLTEEVTALRAELAAAPSSDELAEAKARVGALETEIEHLNERIRAVGTRLREADAALDDRQAQLDEVQAELEVARSTVAGAGDEATSLREAMAALEAERDELRSQLAAQGEAAAGATDALDASRAEVVAATERADAAEAAAAAAATRIDHLQAELADARAESEDLVAQLAESADPDVIDLQARRIVDLATALETARADRDEAVTARDAAVAAHEAAATAAATSGEAVESLQRQLDERTAEAERLTSMLADRDRELEGERATAAAATASADEIRGRFAALEETAQGETAALEDARTTVASLQERIVELETNLAASRETRARVVAIADAMRGALEAVSATGHELFELAAALEPHMPAQGEANGSNLEADA